MMFDGPNDKHNDKASEQYPQRRTKPLSCAYILKFGLALDAKEDKIVGGHESEDRRENRHIFSADKGFERELHITLLEKRTFRDESGDYGRPIFELLTELLAKECFFNKHNAFVINPINQGYNDECPNIHRKN